ncbi:unnamed protein product [Euphydryas editha]|uniref:Integrase catalytic domain-containing protein n=1 Tax=Euphydryas editha TaxID=104508 RepID=A0AAU9VFF7_EUPED|nr:unnamed protein product [Euphydryas editha]
MKVKFASQVFSCTVASNMGYLAGSNTQFGFRPQLEPQRQFGYKPVGVLSVEIGYKPPQFRNNLQQFGYKPPQLQGSRFQETDVSMRIAVPRPQPQTLQQSFRLNELTLGNDDLQDYYDTYYNNDGYEHDTTYRMYDDDSNLIDYNDESEGWKNEDLPKTEDPGSEFNNELMKEFISLRKVEMHIGTPNNPNSEGVIERLHSKNSEIYRCAKYEKKCTDAASVMIYSIISYNHSIHSATGLTPFEVVFGHTDSGSPFNVNFKKPYVQQLVKDHAKRTKFLYKYLTEKITENTKELGKRRVVKVKDNSPKEKPFSRKRLIKERVKISRVTLNPK